MNQVTIYFIECKPAPPKGYRVYWRVAGSGPLSFLGHFFASPIVFFDDSPVGTNYEGVIVSEFNNMTCSSIPWSTIGGGGSGGSGSGSGSGGGIGNPIFGALDISELSICSQGLEQLYLNPPYIIIQPGANLYYDQALTMPVIGFMFVRDQGGEIFNLDIDDGRVLSPTGNFC